MAITGAIADRVKGIIPITWDALLGDSRYGETFLRTAIDTVKVRVTGVNMVPANESGTYSLPVIDYLAKLSALDLINPGIDFWMNQPISETATGTSEVHGFVDRVAALQELRRALLEETRNLEDEILPLIDFTILARSPKASIDTMTDDFLTPSPQEFPRPFVRTNFS